MNPQSEKISIEEFESVINEHINSLYHYGLMLTRSHADSEDLVQETCLKAFKAYDSQFQKGTNIKAWMLTILKNTFVNQYRKKKREGTQISIDDEQGKFSFYSQTVSQARTSPEDYHGSEKLTSENLEDLFGDEVLSALNNLSEEYREVIFLCDVNEMAYQEIADLLEIPIGTVRSRLSRARSALNKELWQYAVEKGVLKKKE